MVAEMCLNDGQVSVDLSLPTEHARRYQASLRKHMLERSEVRLHRPVFTDDAVVAKIGVLYTGSSPTSYGPTEGEKQWMC